MILKESSKLGFSTFFKIMVKSPTVNEFNKIFLSVSTASTECKLQLKVFLPVFLQTNNVVVREPNLYLS